MQAQFLASDYAQYNQPCRELLRQFVSGGPNYIATWLRLVDETAEWRLRNILQFATIDLPADAAALFGLSVQAPPSRILEVIDRAVAKRR